MDNELRKTLDVKLNINIDGTDMQKSSFLFLNLYRYVLRSSSYLRNLKIFIVSKFQRRGSAACNDTIQQFSVE